MENHLTQKNRSCPPRGNRDGTWRLAHFVQRYPPALGGAESYFARLSRTLAAAGHRVTVHTSNAVALEAFWDAATRRVAPGVSVEAGVRIVRHPVRYFPGRKVMMKLVSYLPNPAGQAAALPCNPLLPTLVSAMATHEPVDAVHATAFPYGQPIVAAWWLARRLQVPFLLTPFLHLGDPDRPDDRTRRAYLAPCFRWLLHQADRIFVQTELEYQAVAAVGVPGGRIVLQGLGVDPAECTGGQKARAIHRWGLPDQVPIIGHLANLSQEKGTIDLVRAMQTFWDRGLKAHVALAGPSMPNFRTFLRTVPVRYRRNVTLTGPLAETDKPDFYATCDVFALPSYSDSFGLVLLEAWANGVPCVGYRCGGIAEVIRHADDGLLAAAGDIAGLAGHLEKLIADPQFRQDLGARGRIKVQTEHRWPDKLGIVSRVLAEVI
jgi:glycosyltransferase involved in cell wall biosynthesis